MNRMSWIVGGGLTIAVLLPLASVRSQDVDSDTLQQILTGGRTQTLNARCIGSIAAPSTVYAGEKFSAQLTVRNTSSVIWRRALVNKIQPFFLGSQSPQDNMTWGLNRVPLPSSSLGRNVNTTFRFTPIAPATPGIYPFSWQMLQEGNKWFGGICTKNIEVKPARNKARGVSIEVPDTITSGQQFSATITMKNTGKGTWLASDNNPYGIQSRVPPDNLIWGVKRTTLTANTNPGENAVFHVTATAPINPGSYNFAWRMIQGDRSFGTSVLKKITVQSAAVTPTPSPIPTQTQTVTITPNPYDGQVPTPTPNGYDAQTPYISALSVNITSPAENSVFLQGTQIPLAVSGNGTPTCGTWTLTKPNGETVTLAAADFVEGRLPGGISSCTSAYDAY